MKYLARLQTKTMKSYLYLTTLLIFASCSPSKPNLESLEKPKNQPVKVVLLDERVSVDIPKRWKRIKETPNKQQYLIPFKETDNTPHSANASIVTEYCDDSLDVRNYSDSILARMINPAKGNIIINDNLDGTYWRSVLWRGQNQVPYVIWDRFGVNKGISVHFRVAYPLLENSTQSRQSLTDEINATTESLKIR